MALWRQAAGRACAAASLPASSLHSVLVESGLRRALAAATGGGAGARSLSYFAGGSSDRSGLSSRGGAAAHPLGFRAASAAAGTIAARHRRKQSAALCSGHRSARPYSEKAPGAGAATSGDNGAGTSSALPTDGPGWPWPGAATAHGPAIPVNGDDVTVLSTPAEFYSTILDGVRSARRRVALGSLYFGSGELETALTGAVADAVRAQPDLHVQLLVDHTRGTRGRPSSADLMRHVLAAAAENNGGSGSAGRVDACMYLTPALTPALRAVLRPPFNEVVGLQHAKVYLWDDTVLLTGANLSESYFTDRQDRYVVVRSAKLADFMADLIGVVCSVSTRLTPGGAVESPLRADPVAFAVEAGRRVDALLARHTAANNPNVASGAPDNAAAVGASNSEQAPSPSSADQEGGAPDTVVYPLVQAGPWAVRHDEAATVALLESLPAGVDAWLATGYFNLPPRYVDAVLASRGSVRVLTASPAANGFLGARGALGHIPAVYTALASRFLREVDARGETDRVWLLEYERPGFTFHAKGLWLHRAGEATPWCTLVGSPNFGERSVARDIECQVALATANPRLRDALNEERRRLFEFGERVTADALALPGRRPTAVQKVASVLIRSFF